MDFSVKTQGRARLLELFHRRKADDGNIRSSRISGRMVEHIVPHPWTECQNRLDAHEGVERKEEGGGEKKRNRPIEDRLARAIRVGW